MSTDRAIQAAIVRADMAICANRAWAWAGIAACVAVMLIIAWRVRRK